MSKFTADIDAFILKSNNLMEAVFKESAQRTIEEAQTPRAKGGNMRVDTGFLRNSGKASINALPIGETENTGVMQPDWNDSVASLTINRAKVGDSIYFGWTANYAQARENKDGFVRLAAQNWQKTVNQVARDLKARKR